MRFIAVMFVAIIGGATAGLAVSSVGGCHSATVASVGSAAVCVGVDVTQNAKADAGTIVGDIFSAVITGGATLKPLIAQLIKDFGEPVVECASIIVDQITGIVPPEGSSAPKLTFQQSAGHSALKAEMKARGWPTTP